MDHQEKIKVLKFIINRNEENLDLLLMFHGSNKEKMEEQIKFYEYITYLILKDLGGIYTED